MIQPNSRSKRPRMTPTMMAHNGDDDGQVARLGERWPRHLAQLGDDIGHAPGLNRFRKPRGFQRRPRRGLHARCGDCGDGASAALGHLLGGAVLPALAGSAPAARTTSALGACHPPTLSPCAAGVAAAGAELAELDPIGIVAPVLGTSIGALAALSAAERDDLAVAFFPSPSGASYSSTLVTTPAPTVRPPSRIAKRRPSSTATG